MVVRGGVVVYRDGAGVGKLLDGGRFVLLALKPTKETLSPPRLS